MTKKKYIKKIVNNKLNYDNLMDQRKKYDSLIEDHKNFTNQLIKLKFNKSKYDLSNLNKNFVQ